MDQGSRALVAMRVDDDGELQHLWERRLTVSARPAIVSDRGVVYATDFRDGRNHLVVLDLASGDERCRIQTPATRATVSTIVVSAADEVYFGSNQPGQDMGMFHRFYVP